MPKRKVDEIEISADDDSNLTERKRKVSRRERNAPMKERARLAMVSDGVKVQAVLKQKKKAVVKPGVNSSSSKSKPKNVDTLKQHTEPSKRPRSTEPEERSSVPSLDLNRNSLQRSKRLEQGENLAVERSTFTDAGGGISSVVNVSSSTISDYQRPTIQSSRLVTSPTGPSSSSSSSSSSTSDSVRLMMTQVLMGGSDNPNEDMMTQRNLRSYGGTSYAVGNTPHVLPDTSTTHENSVRTSNMQQSNNQDVDDNEEVVDEERYFIENESVVELAPEASPSTKPHQARWSLFSPIIICFLGIVLFSDFVKVNWELDTAAEESTIPCDNHDFICPTKAICEFGRLVGCSSVHYEVSESREMCVFTQQTNESIATLRSLLVDWTIHDQCGGSPSESFPLFDYSKLKLEKPLELSSQHLDLGIVQQEFVVQQKDDTTWVGLPKDHPIPCSNHDFVCPTKAICEFGRLVGCSSVHYEVSESREMCVFTQQTNESISTLRSLLVDWTIHDQCGGSPSESFPLFDYSKLKLEMPFELSSQHLDLDVVQQQFVVEQKDDTTWVGLPKDHPLEYPVGCLMGGFLKWSLSWFGSIMLISSQSLARFAWTCMSAHPFVSLSGLFLVLAFQRRRSNQARRARVSNDIADVRQLVYERLQDDPSLSYVVLHIRDEIAMALHPNSKTRRGYIIKEVWPRVVPEVSHDSRIRETKRLVDGNPQDMWQWCSH